MAASGRSRVGGCDVTCIRSIDKFFFRLVKWITFIPINLSKHNGPYAPFGFESIKKQLWRNKQNDRPISDSEIKAVLSQLFKTDQWMPSAGHVSEDVTSHA
ncbi:hypothetical protein AVEN_37449-1 [Araneus ventricosus]|uniref:Uncharacterized protein n=1 Tax=Araneus ventricosus TaxID=182803 RepID=A0A4Y2FBT6_ARAVE|nr:hypothetical protein AVEN_37449-1 [Araneus ventricosus]